MIVLDWQRSPDAAIAESGTMLILSLCLHIYSMFVMAHLLLSGC